MSLRRNTTLQSLLAAKEALLPAKKGRMFFKNNFANLEVKLTTIVFFIHFQGQFTLRH